MIASCVNDMCSFQITGHTIVSSDFLRSAHNALSPPSAISLDGLNLPKSSEDAYHFVVYLPFAGALYELDGLRRAPIRHGAVEGGGKWLHRARWESMLICRLYAAILIIVSLGKSSSDGLQLIQRAL